MNTSVLPTRVSAKISVVLCSHAMCFAAIPAEQADQHEKWHATQKKMTS